MEIFINRSLTVEQLADVYRRSGIRRPVDDLPRMQRMLENANLIVSAWEGKRLMAVARCFTDYGWVCYLSDLAVDRAAQRLGTGRALIERVRAYIGPQCQLVLLSAPEALAYYPKVGFERANHAFFIKRSMP